MIVDISGNIFEIEPQKKKENNFINKILNIIPFQEVGNKYVAPLEWIYSFKALALKNKITDWDRKPGFVAWSNSLQKTAVEIECSIREVFGMVTIDCTAIKLKNSLQGLYI